MNNKQFTVKTYETENSQFAMLYNIVWNQEAMYIQVI